MDYIYELKAAGYKYIIMPLRKKRTFYATKAVMKKDGTFKDNSNFDEFNLEKNESWPFDRGTYINLQA